MVTLMDGSETIKLKDAIRYSTRYLAFYCVVHVLIGCIFDMQVIVSTNVLGRRYNTIACYISIDQVVYYCFVLAHPAKGKKLIPQSLPQPLSNIKLICEYENPHGIHEGTLPHNSSSSNLRYHFCLRKVLMKLLAQSNSQHYKKVVLELR